VAVLEIIVTIISVIGILLIGICIGKEYGSFEAFILSYIEKLNNNLNLD
jgi:hypothetical protein